jgi:hypothetical protein
MIDLSESVVPIAESVEQIPRRRVHHEEPELVLSVRFHVRLRLRFSPRLWLGLLWAHLLAIVGVGAAKR